MCFCSGQAYTLSAACVCGYNSESNVFYSDWNLLLPFRDRAKWSENWAKQKKNKLPYIYDDAQTVEEPRKHSTQRNTTNEKWMPKKKKEIIIRRHINKNVTKTCSKWIEINLMAIERGGCARKRKH